MSESIPSSHPHASPSPKREGDSPSAPTPDAALSADAIGSYEEVVPTAPPPPAASLHRAQPAWQKLETDAKRPRRRPPPPRRILLPLMLFLGTCASTFWVGACGWEPLRADHMQNWTAVASTIAQHWPNGLRYMVAVVGILLTHEMGHFLQTVKHKIHASYPLCIPIPFNSIGTMGAVIGMDGLRANRKQIFDIGIAGPLAGLIVAFPVLWFGIRQLDLSRGGAPGEIEFYLPLVGQWMLQWAHPDASWADAQWVPLSALNPYFMAGWVGMLITGLNMLPISQLDGGHTMYALFLDRAHGFAKMFISFAIFYVVAHLEEAVMWTFMLVLVILMGIHHPPTADDEMELGHIRWGIGLASLSIPVLCFPLLGVR